MSEALFQSRPQPYFEDVTVGDEIPVLVKGPYTVMNMAYFAAVTGDFFPSHYDNKWAIEKSGHPGALVHGLQITTYMSQMVTDWIGGWGKLKAMSAQNRERTIDGDTITFHGKVTNKYQAGSDHFVELELSGLNQKNILVITGTAKVILPSNSA